MKSTPSNRALRFLRWFCHEDRIEEIEGDLIELFENRAIHSPREARIRFIRDVIKSIRWVNLKTPNFFPNSGFMIKNYLKIGYRNLFKDLSYSLINLLGLSLGLAVFIIMIMIVHHEYTFDHFHKKGKVLISYPPPLIELKRRSFFW